jgi:hypothetical protein
VNLIGVAGFREPGVWPATWKLLRLELLITWNSFWRAKLRRKIGLIALGVVFIMFLGFIVFLSISLLAGLRSPMLAEIIGDTAPLLDSFPVFMLSAAASGILLTSFGVMLQALYLSGDMDFLMSAPIPVRSIFVAKLLQGILPNFAILCLFTLPLLFGLGISGGYSLFFYPLALLVLIALTLAAAGLAALLVMLAARVVPARRLAEVLGFVVGTSMFILSQSSQLMRFEMGQEQLASMLRLVERFNQPWSPLAWAGRGLVLLGKGSILEGLALTLAGLAVAVGVFYAALVVAERMYYTGWSSLQNNRSERRKKTNNARPSGFTTAAANRSSLAESIRPGLTARLFPTPIRAVMIKDWLLYRRDLRNLSRLLTPIILGVVYAFSFFQGGERIPEGQGNAPEWAMRVLEGVVIYTDIALALFMGWMFTANLGGLSFSMEGKHYWMVKVAPIGSRALLAAKFLVAYLPTLAICSFYVIVLQVLKGPSLWDIVLGLSALAAILAGLTGIYLAFGVLGARFDWTKPNEVNRTTGCLSGIAGLIFAPMCFILFAAPAIAAGFLEFPLWIGQLGGAGLGISAGLAGVLIPLRLVEKRVARLMEV